MRLSPLQGRQKCSPSEGEMSSNGQRGSIMSKNEFIPFEKHLKDKARRNRKKMNQPEARLWYEVLRKRKLQGYKFLRQKPIGNFIVDFFCAKLLLVIEVDGESHSEQIEYDKRRTENLKSSGIKVIRYTNYEVLQNLEGVYLDLEKQIKIREGEIG